MDSNPSPVIRLDQFLKLVGAVRTGGEAKVRIQSGEVRVNGEVEVRRSRKLREGDGVDARGERWIVTREAILALDGGEGLA